MKFVFSQLKQCKENQRGFSLIELLITIGIVVMVTGAVLVKHTSFSNSTLLKAQAHEIGLDIRAAQQYGISARADRSNIRAAYGIYFDAADPSRYQLYLDADDDKLYDSGGGEAVGSAYVLDNRFFIKEVCIGANCSDRRAGSIAFQRPNFDAVIGHTNTSGGAYGLHGATAIEIVIASTADDTATRSIIVYSTGQIEVQ